MARFKSYIEGHLPIEPLTLLIGANASGKSNAIEALHLLSWLAHGQQLDDILRSVQDEDIRIRGTISDLVYDQGDTFILGCDLDSWHSFHIDVRVDKQHMRVVGEALVAPGENVPLYEVKNQAHGYGHDIRVAYNNFARGGKKPQIQCTDQQAVFTQLGTPARFEKGKAGDVIPRAVAGLRTALERILFLDPNPRYMRRYSFVVDDELRGDGRNLSSVLFKLCQDAEQKTQILEFIRALPEQDIRDIAFIETPRNEVMVQLVETFAGRDQARDAPVLSDGTLRALAVIAALLSARDGSLVVIEEIDNGVHPSRARKLLEKILTITEQRGLRVLVTTHNPALLDALPERAVPHVVFCYRDPDQGDSRLVQLQELERYPELVARGPLGQLMTQGIIERFVKERRSAEDHARDHAAWLNALREQVDRA